jgi:preprotein translocase subunit SecA
MLMRQNPLGAAQFLVDWANRRYGLEWTVDKLRTRPPQVARTELMEACRKALEGGRLAQDVATAQACKDDDELDRHLKDKYGVNLPDWMRHLEGEERMDAIRARVESVVRAELVQFEQTLLLQTLDHSWKDHLYAMDVLRDTINFRAYSQQDPRTEFKREGAKAFQQMLEGVRDRITDDIFKVRLQPGPMPPQAPPPQRPMNPPLAAGGPGRSGGGGAPFGSSFSAPGLDPNSGNSGMML